MDRVDGVAYSRFQAGSEVAEQLAQIGGDGAGAGEVALDTRGVADRAAHLVEGAV